MDRQYRSGGVTVALGRPSIAYTEGRCAGGGTEINSGLYRRPAPDTLERWRGLTSIVDFDDDEFYAACDEIERTLQVQTVPGSTRRPASGCATAPPRCTGATTRSALDDLSARHRRRQRRASEHDPHLPAAGSVSRGAPARRAPGRATGRATATVAFRAELIGPDGGPCTIDFEHVVVCAGAIQTPALLQRSGHRGLVGRNLAVHPTVKLAARFEDMVNVVDDVPVHQVKEFSPDLSFGGSASQPGLVALALTDHWSLIRATPVSSWRQIAVYYAAITSEGRGPRSMALPGLHDPLVTYRLTARDRAVLGQGLARLALVMLAAGASEVYPSFRGAPIVRSRADLADARASFAATAASVMTVHLCSTVPMGEDRSTAAADSFGRLHGADNIHVNDASLLPGPRRASTRRRR